MYLQGVGAVHHFVLNFKEKVMDEFDLNLKKDDKLTSVEVRQLIERGLENGEEVILQIGETKRVISWIGRQAVEDPPLSSRWKIVIK